MSGIVYKLDGKVVTKEEFRADAKAEFAPPMTANTYTEHDPLISEGMGCMKSQVGEMRDVIRQHNIQGAQVKDNGQVVLTSRRARRELLQARGLVDNDGGYGD